MADLDCRIVAMLALALSLLSLSGVIFVRHQHNHVYYHTPEAFVTERECLDCEGTSSNSGGTSTSDDGMEFGSDKPSTTNSIATPRSDKSNETSSHGNRGAFDISEACLQCICEAGTECKPAKCAKGLECGVFRISKGYWTDAGSPTVRNFDGGISGEEAETNSEKAYLQCVNNPFCAARAVKSYIGRYIRDCDNDGIIDCYDYAAIHIQGPTGCKLDELTPMIFGRLYRCLNQSTVKTKRNVV